MTKIAVLGNGSWGSVLGSLLADNGHDVILYGNIQAVNDEINAHHTNEHYIKNWHVNENASATGDLKEALTGADVVLFVLPTKAFRIVAKNVRKVLDELGTSPLVVTATKGIEPGSMMLMSDILGQEVYPNDPDKIIAVSGPSHAENVAQKDITCLTCASKNADNAMFIQSLFQNEYMRFYGNDDLIGVEVGGAVKNVIALAAGIVAGKGYGDNAKAALMTRGLVEIARLGVEHFGAKRKTFNGLSGMGDLIVTCTSVNSRNWRAGKQLGEGKTLDYVLENMGQVVEGATTVKAIHELVADSDIEMPISEAVYRVCYENSDVDKEIEELMGRSLKSE
ncbi:MAG: NAD(P)H-dependent glycerol-3-phosphate dehydrogenase [Lactobacillus sp.]|nr:NAD(P)H-dependent glycerol-3-phosphate dehydrogenase [Lactobacillus sp.]